MTRVPEPASAPLAAHQGRHLLADLYDCAAPLDSLELVDRAMRAAVAASGATLIDMHLHHFGDGQGVTGVAILAESHMSIHSWPEHRYAALDFFLCGQGNDADAALDAMVAHLLPGHMTTAEHPRGYGAMSG